MIPRLKSGPIVQTLRKLDREVQYIIVPDEDHGFARDKIELRHLQRWKSA